MLYNPLSEQSQSPDFPSVELRYRLFGHLQIRSPQTLNCVVKCSLSQIVTSQVLDALYNTVLQYYNHSMKLV